MATEKLSATVDADLLAEVKAIAGERALSAFVNEALLQAVRRDRFRRYLDQLDEEDGPIPRAEIEAEKASILAELAAKAADWAANPEPEAYGDLDDDFDIDGIDV